MYGEENPETPWKDSLSHLSCISRIFRPECSFDRKDAMNPCTGSWFSSPIFPGKSERILQIRKKQDNQIKTRIPSLAAWARIPGRQVQGGCRTFLYAQRWRLILRGPQYCLAGICIRVFVLSFSSQRNPVPPPGQWLRYLHDFFQKVQRLGVPISPMKKGLWKNLNDFFTAPFLIPKDYKSS